MGTLDGKVALITGAGQGIGQGIALALAKEGAEIAVAGRTESKLHTTCGLLADIGARGEVVVCDVSKKDDQRLANLLAQKRARFQLGRIDELFVE